MSAGNEKDLQRLLKKDVLDWSVSDVGLWLSNVGLDEYKLMVMNQAISGLELVDLTLDDLGSIGISKLGDKKKILREVRLLVDGKANQDAVAPNFDNSSDSSAGPGGSRSSGPKGSSTRSSRKDGKIDIKVRYRCLSERFLVKEDISLSDLRRKVRKIFGKSLSLSYEDSDGDTIRIRRDRDLKLAFKGCGGRLHISATSSTRAQAAAKNEIDTLSTLTNPVIMIDEVGVITFFNPAAEEFFGYRKAAVIGSKINMLMPDEYAVHHDDYLAQYVKTGVKKVMGSGRKVQATKRNGTVVDVFLTLSESKTRSGRHFIGTLQDLSSGQEAIASDQTAHFTILQSIMDPAIVINQKGIVQFFNAAASTLFGYKPAQIVGKNVNMLMQGREKREHDSYLANYFLTGKSSVLGKGREVVGADSKGQLIPLHLSVSEEKIGSQSLFTGLCRPLSNNVVQEDVAKTQLEQLREVLEDLMVASIITDDIGTVQFINNSAEELLGFTLVGIVGKNVKLMMPPEHALHHDDYLKKWRETGEEHVFGVGRTLQAKHGVTGNLIDIRLSVSKRMSENGRYLLIGTILPV